MQDVNADIYFPRANCDARDDFSSLWKKLFQDITFEEKKQEPGFVSKTVSVIKNIADCLPETLTPDLIRRTLSSLPPGIIFAPVFDEFDRIQNPDTSTLMADTIKGLSDFGVNTTLLLIGVADSIDELIGEHQSIERALIQIPMQRMSNDEVITIIDNGISALGMTIEDVEKETVVDLSQGLPHITHLLSLHSTKSAVKRESKKIQRADIKEGIRISLQDWQQSIKSAYYQATKSPQPGNIFREVILACAFSETDDFGYFSAANVRSPLNTICPDRSYDIPNYARHLKLLSGPDRGVLLDRMGEKRRLRYRFNSPLMRPYIVMRAINDQIITRDQLSGLIGENANASVSHGL